MNWLLIIFSNNNSINYCCWRDERWNELQENKIEIIRVENESNWSLPRFFTFGNRQCLSFWFNPWAVLSCTRSWTSSPPSASGSSCMAICTATTSSLLRCSSPWFWVLRRYRYSLINLFSSSIRWTHSPLCPSAWSSWIPCIAPLLLWSPVLRAPSKCNQCPSSE